MRIVGSFCQVLLGTTIFVLSQSSFSSDCKSDLIHQATIRVLDQQEKLRDQFIGQDYLAARPCFDDLLGVSASALDDELAQSYVELECKIAASAKGEICTNRRDSFDVVREWVPICTAPGNCLLEYYAKNAEVKPDDYEEFGATGGIPFGWLFGHLGKDGHYEITTQALEEFAKTRNILVSKVALEIMRAASQDPDFYDWETAAAHGQTVNDNDTAQLAESNPPAGRQFVQWTMNHLRNAEKFCSAGKQREAIYLIGYALHAVQDVVFHDGMSNAEHAYRDTYRSRVDTEFYFIEKKLLAKEASLAIFEVVLSEKNIADRPCKPALLKWSGAGKLRTEEKYPLIGKDHRDLTIAAYRKFKALATTIHDFAYCESCTQSKYIIEPKWLEWDRYTGKPEGLKNIRARLRGFIQSILEVGSLQ